MWVDQGWGIVVTQGFAGFQAQLRLLLPSEKYEGGRNELTPLLALGHFLPFWFVLIDMFLVVIGNVLQYFTLRIKSNRTDNLLKFDGAADGGEKLDYFAFNMQNDLSLVAGKDTLACVLHHFERTYNIAPYCDFLIAFELPVKNNSQVEDKIFIFEDKLFKLGTIKLKIKKEDLHKVPTLIYKKNESES